MFVGFNLTFLVQHSMGLSGMPRRIYTYSQTLHVTVFNEISTFGSFILGIGVLIPFVNVLISIKHGKRAGNDPWRANTLEWFVSSPPPPNNFDVVPRVRSVDGSAEVAVPAYDLFASRDLLNRMAVERMLAGLSTRRYGVGLEPVGSEVEASAIGTSKSAVSRRFVALTRTALAELMARRLDDLRPLVLMIDGEHVADHLCVVALVIDAEGRKIPVGLVEGATENATVVTGLLEDLVARGLDFSGGVLVVIDGSRALATAVRKVVGRGVPVQRCQEHKIRNVIGYLPKGRQGFVRRKLRAAYALDDAARAQRDLEALARSLERDHPGAAASLREGLAETLTVIRLQLSPTLRRTLRSTNPIESMIGSCRTTARNVKRFRDGEMALRWTAAGMVEAEKRFRRIKGCRDLPLLARAIAHHCEDVRLDRNTKAA